MTEESELIIIVAIIGILVLVPVVLFFVEEQRLLQRIQPGNRLLTPGNVWLQLIPLFGLIYQFIVINRIADSIRNELSDASNNDWLLAGEVTDIRPTYRKGLACAILFCCSLIKIPVLETLIGLAAIVCWIMYWIDLRKYSLQIRQRRLEGA